MTAIRHLKVVGPASKKRTVALPVRKPNAAYRSREHLIEREVERLVEAAKDNRWGLRDATMVLLAFRHGLRASELVDLRWEQADLENAILHVRRVK
jgi:type 1 fimbriae regulatory protein FimB/type 1 fimbriae regulatory protein FimE